MKPGVEHVENQAVYGAEDTFRGDDLEDVRENVSKVFRPHRFELEERGRKLNTALKEETLDNLSLVYLQYGAPVRVDPGCLRKYYLVQVPLAGEIDVTFGKNRFLLDREIISFISPDQYLDMRWRENSDLLTLKINKSFVDRKLAHLLQATPRQDLIFDHILDRNSDQGMLMMNSINYIRMQMEILSKLPPETRRNNPLYQGMSRHMEDTLVNTLLMMQQHSLRDQLFQSRDSCVPGSVKKVQDFIHARLERNISLDDLVITGGVSVATLTRNFQRFLNTTPMQYLRDQRLAAVHAALTRPEGDVSVTDVALKYQFHHLGRFSALYRNRYFETPSQTLQKSRA